MDKLPILSPGDIQQRLQSVNLSTSDSSSSILSTSPDSFELSNTSQCYENSTFGNDDTWANTGERFVSAFGQKGKQIGEFEDAKDLCCLSNGRLLITDMVVGRLQKFAKNISSVTVIAPKDITHPWGVTVSEDNRIIISLCKERCVKVFDAQGELLQTIGEGMFQCPVGVACDAQGRIVVCDAEADRVLIFDNDGTFIKYLGEANKKEERFSKPRYVCVSNIGNIIVCDSGHHNVKIFNYKDEFLKSFGSFGKENGQFKYPYGVCTNTFGEIFVADHYNSRISMFSQDGVFIRNIVTNDHGLVHPQGLRIDSSMNMYITHGHLKATEVLVFKLSHYGTISGRGEFVEIITHV